MKNHLTLESARNLTDDHLFAALRDGLSMSEDGIRHAAISVTVLEERGRDMSMLPDTFRFSREIAEGELSAHAAWLLARIPFAIRAILPMPTDMQDQIADGKRIKVAVKKDGRMMHKDLTIFEMSQGQMRLAFSDDGIVSAEEQGQFLHKATEEVLHKIGMLPPAKVRPKISVDAGAGDIVVGRTHISVDDLMPALAALGYIVKPAYGSKKIKPVKVK